ncbi:leukemia NUP98 fusion partner 1 [Arapaima gigas]
MGVSNRTVKPSNDPVAYSWRSPKASHRSGFHTITPAPNRMGLGQQTTQTALAYQRDQITWLWLTVHPYLPQANPDQGSTLLPRVYPTIIMDNDEDDDGNFAKWMSSYWGHNATDKGRERRYGFRRQIRPQRDRRASLPSPAQLDTLQLNYLHTTTMAPMPVPLKLKEEMELRLTPRDSRVSSSEAAKNPPPENRAIATIPELAETFNKKLHFRSRNSDADNTCLICHEEMWGSDGVIRELHCSHRFHRECIERWLWKEQSCPTCSVHIAMPESLYWSSTHATVP